MWKKRGVYYERIDGEAVSLGTKVFKEAQTKVAELRLRDSGRASQHKNSMTLLVALGGMRSEKKRAGKAKGTQDMYGWKGDRLRAFFGDDFDVRDFNAFKVEAFCIFRETGGMEPYPLPTKDGSKPKPRRPVERHTISKELTCLRQTLRYAKRHNAWEGDIEALIPEGYSGCYVPRERVVSFEEVKRILDDCTNQEQVIYTCYSLATSGRHGEILAAYEKDIHLERGVHGEVWLRGTKTPHSARWVPLTKHTRPLMDIVLRLVPKGRKLILTKQTKARFLSRKSEKLGMVRVTPNDLRRTFATRLAEAQVPLFEVAQTLGHKDTRMVEKVYAKFQQGTLSRNINAKLEEPAGRALAKEATKHAGKVRALPVKGRPVGLTDDEAAAEGDSMESTEAKEGSKG